MNMISPAQLRMIYGLSRRCDMDEETLHAMVLAQTGVASLKQLTSHQAAQIIDQLRIKAGEPVREDIPGRASDGQRRMIRSVIRELGWTDERLRAFLDKRYHVSDVAFLPCAKCGAVIEALKAMRDGGRGDRRERYG